MGEESPHRLTAISHTAKFPLPREGFGGKGTKKSSRGLFGVKKEGS